MGGRWGRAGQAAARPGATVGTEYYFNDAGAQIDRFADSLLAAARSQAPPEDGYAGEYIGEIVRAVLTRHPDLLGRPDSAAREVFRSEGVALMFDEIKTSLADFGGPFRRLLRGTGTA